MRGRRWFGMVLGVVLAGALGAQLGSPQAAEEEIPNLAFYQPDDWSAPVVISTQPGTFTDSPVITPADTLYLDFAVANFGTASASASFQITLHIDGVLHMTWISDPLDAGFYAYASDFSIDSLSPGAHTFQITADSSGVILESAEDDNVFVKDIIVSSLLPSIRVEPLTLQFPSELDSAFEPQALTSNDPGRRMRNTPLAALPGDKMVGSVRLQEDEQNQSKVSVIVNLAAPVALLAQTDFRSPRSVRALQPEIRRVQQEVLDSLPGSDLRVRNRFDNIAGFSADVTARGLRALQADPRVASIEPVYLLDAHLAQGIPAIHGSTYRSAYNGAGVAIAICDTGIDYNHPELGGGGFPNDKVIGGYDFGDDDPDPIPQGQAHGTSCAGIAAGALASMGDYIGGVAHNAKLYALKISYGTTGTATSDAIVAAWDWCVTHQYDDPDHPIMVISTSFGGGRYFSACDLAVPSLTTAAENAVAAGITILASSGNDGYCDSTQWPACLSSVISVGAIYDGSFGTYTPCVNAASCAPKIAAGAGSCGTGWYCEDVTQLDLVTSYANAAPFLGLLAPANQCATLDISGPTGYTVGDYFDYFGGTSAACPYAAGAVACLQSAAMALTGSYLTVAEVKSRLISSGDPVTDLKADLTTPRINLARAINGLAQGGQIFRIFNDGPGDLVVQDISLDAPANWISFFPNVSFLLRGGQSQDVTVTVDFAQAPAGETSRRLLITSNDSARSPYPDGVHVVVSNSAPIISPIDNQQTTSGQPTAEIPFGIDDAETGASALLIMANSSDADLMPESSIVFGGSGTDRHLILMPALNRSGTCTITVSVSDGSSVATESFDLTVNSTVRASHVFYNQSAFDGNSPAAESQDDAAIAPDKTPLRPGGKAAFANYTSFSRGLNGIIIDIAGLPSGPLTAADFQFKVGNNSTPAGWAAAPDPAVIDIRPGAGAQGSDRVTLIWPNNQLQKTWLEVTVLATALTGLATPHVFYFGNAIGESGDSAADAKVNPADELLARSNLRSLFNPAPIDFRFDYNRDKRVDPADQLIARANQTTVITALKLLDFSPPSPPP